MASDRRTSRGRQEARTPERDESTAPGLDESGAPGLDESGAAELDESAVPPPNESAVPVGSEGRLAPFADALAERAETDRLRTLRHYRPEPRSPFVARGEARFLSFSSNDYLGLATDPDVEEGAASFARRYGAGAGASRLVTGGLEIHAALEGDLAAFAGRDAALLFASGYQANTTVIPALVGRSGAVFCDRRSHNSILQGAQLSRGKLVRFEHNEPTHLDELLGQNERAGVRLIVTESVFSMDGDQAPLAEIATVAERHGALLMVDDAHAIGVWGEGGRGLAPEHRRVDLVLGTFGKAFGASGAFVATSATVRDHLVNFCGGFIYSTAPPPPTIGAVAVALAKVTSGELGRERYHARIADVHARLRAAGFDTAPSDTQIVPIRLGNERSALDCARFLEERGILAVPMRPPTVPAGTSRLRVSVTSLHTAEHVDRLVSGLVAFRTARSGAGAS